MRDDIQGIMVTLKIADSSALFVLLCADGTINRMGNGSVDNAENDLFIGLGKPEIFHGLCNQLTPELMEWFGQSLAAPDQQGKVCELVLGLKKSDGQELTSAWQYGSESMGPPPEICQFVVAAVEATNPWYEDQKAMAAKGRG